MKPVCLCMHIARKTSHDITSIKQIKNEFYIKDEVEHLKNIHKNGNIKNK